MEEYIKQIKFFLDKVGLQEGDTLYVASDVTLLLIEARKKAGVKTVEQRDKFLHKIIKIFKESVGETGTLLFPTFTWAFCRGNDFDFRHTRGEVGVLSNWLLGNCKEFQRTQHPIYSFLVWGKDAKLLTDMDNTSSFGTDSPFAYLHHRGKLLLFNVSLRRSFTFLHYVEQTVNVPYRYHKEFKAGYIDEDGNRTERIYSMYVRDLDIQSRGYLPEEFLDSRGVTRVARCGELTLRMVDLERAYEVVVEDLFHNQGHNCYKFVDYKIDWTKGQTHENYKIND